MDPQGMSPMRDPTLPPRCERRSKTPFADENRENFPSLDEILAAGPAPDGATPKISKAYVRKRASPSPEGLLDRSTCSQSSSLNMSIGARAALTEHLRHVARYGLDGTPTKNVPVTPSGLQGGDWERYNDGNQSNMSFTTVLNDSTAEAGGPIPLFSYNDDGEEAVEVLAFEDRSDYFDTSRVLQLMTPEKNRGQAIRAITTRGGAPLSSPDNDGRATSSQRLPPVHFAESETGSTPSQDEGLMHLFQAAIDLHAVQPPRCEVPDSSFLSLSAIDVSRLSGGSESDAIKRSPDESFQAPSLVRGGEEQDSRDLLPPVHMTPLRTPPGMLLSSPLSSVGVRRSPGSAGILRESSPAQAQVTEKVNVAAPNFSNFGLSPIAAKAGSTAMKMNTGSLKNRPAFPFPEFDETQLSACLQNNVVETMDSLRNEAPSPISQVNLSGFDLHDLSGIDSSHDLDVLHNSKTNSSGSTGPFSCPDISRTEAIKHIETLPPSRSLPLDLLDRRRYRSVVPRRVLMATEPLEFSVKDDGFSPPPSFAGTALPDFEDPVPEQVSKSLLRSFEDAVVEEDPIKFGDSAAARRLL